MSELWYRLRQARAASGYTQTAIAKALKVKRAAVSQWEATEADKRTAPKLEHLIAFADLTNHSVGWLLGERNRSPADISDQQRPYTTIKKVPVIPFNQVLKWPKIPASKQYRTLYIDFAVSRDLSNRAFATQVPDTSAAPQLKKGDYLIVDTQRQPRKGDLVIARRSRARKAIIRQLAMRSADSERIELKALKRGHGKDIFDAVTPGKIIGVIIEHRRRY